MKNKASFLLCNKLFLLLLIGFLMVVYGRWFLPGPRVANDFSYLSDSILKSSMNIPFVWSEMGAEGIGEYSSFFLWGWPLSFIIGSLANLGLSFIFIEKFAILLAILIFGGIGIWKYTESINLSDSSRFIVTIFYLANTYILLLIDGGQLSIALAYSWFPINFLFIQKSITGEIKGKILAGLFTAILGFFDFRFIYVLVLLSLIRCFYELLLLRQKKLQHLVNWIGTGFVISAVVFGIHAYWILPFLKAPISSKTYGFFTQTSFTSYINLGHSILVLAPHWFINIFGRITTLRFEFIFIPILTFLAPILRPKNYEMGFWLLIATISIFLAKGISPPLPQTYIWLFNHLPGFSLFRDSSKFFFLVALSYVVLLGITVDEIIKRIKLFRIRYLFLLFTILYLLFLIRPVWLGQMTGTFSSAPFQNEYFKLDSLLDAEENFSRVFWIPTLAPLGYSSSKHPRVEAARLVQKRPFAIGTRGTYETFNFLREASYMGEIFDVTGIGYIVYPYLDQRRDNMHPDNIKYYYTFLDQLLNRPWLSKIDGSSIPLLKTKNHQEKFFITPNIWWVIGSDSLYNEAIKSADLRLAKNALIFVEEYQGLGNRIDELPETKIILNKKTNIDLAASFIKLSNLIFPAKNLKFEPDKSGWWKREAKDLIHWRDFLQTKYGIDNQDFDLGSGWAVGEGKKQFTIYNLQFTKGKMLLARVLESTRSGQLHFYQDNQMVGQINTKKEGNNIRWFEIGKLTSTENLIINAVGDINVVNALAVVDESEWIKYKKIAKEYRNQGRVVEFDEKNTQQGQGSVTYQKINPTKYLVRVSGLIKPAFLVFSQNYDYFWKTNGQSPLPVYSLLNGFRISGNGDYIVEFEPQKYVYTGLIISGLTLLVLVFLLIKSSKSS